MEKFKTTYTYDTPSSAGPFKGSLITYTQYKRGDSLRAPFGAATVKSSRRVKDGTTPKESP